MKLVIELDELVEVTKSLESGLDTEGAERVRQLISSSPTLADVAGSGFEEQYTPVEVYVDPEPDDEEEEDEPGVPLREQVLELLSERPMTMTQLNQTTRTTGDVRGVVKRLEAEGLVAVVGEVPTNARPAQVWAVVGTLASEPEAIEQAAEALLREASERNSQILRPGRKPKYRPQSIVDTLARRGPLNVTQLTEALEGASSATVRKYVIQLERAGRIVSMEAPPRKGPGSIGRLWALPGAEKMWAQRLASAEGERPEEAEPGQGVRVFA
jgi:hypothetical protein